MDVKAWEAVKASARAGDTASYGEQMIRELSEPMRCGRCGRRDLPLALLREHDASCALEFVRELSAVESDFEDLFLALTMGHAIWPNPWIQEVAYVAYVIYSLRNRLAALVPLATIIEQLGNPELLESEEWKAAKLALHGETRDPFRNKPPGDWSR